MISLLMWLAILGACFGVGARVLRWLRADVPSLAEELPFAAAIGMGVLSYLMLVVGLLGWLHVWVAAVLLAALLLIGRKDARRLLRGAPRILAAATPRRAGPFLLSLFLLLVLILTLLGALAPANDSDYDSLVYHLAIPKIYVQDARIHFIPWLTHSSFPFTLEMLYTLGLLLRDQTLAKLFHFGCGWLLVCAIFAFGRRWWSARAGWLGATIFLAIPLLAWQMMTAYIELGVALYVFLAIFALARLFEERAEGRGFGWLWVAALCCGWALGVKMLAGAVLIFAVLALLAGLRAEGHRRLAVRHLVAFALIAVVIAAPWYVKSTIWTGNPVYPFFHEIFDGRYWSTARAQLYTAAQQEFGVGRGPLDFASLPWMLTMHPQEFFDQPDRLRPFNVYVLAFGPLLLALLPALLAVGPVGRPGRLCLWFALLFTAIWFTLTQNGRYLIPMLPGLAACAGLAADRLLARRGIARAAATTALALGFMVGLYPTLLLAAPGARVAVGLESRSEYLTRVSDTYRTFTAIAAATPPEARILLLGDEPRTFYLDRDYLLGDHAEIFSPEDLATPSSFITALNSWGVTHIAIHSSTLQNVTQRSGLLETRIADLVAAGWLQHVGDYGSLSLWELVGKESARA
jgi:hypothetical protein